MFTPPPTPVAEFLATHPRYAVLPAPYFEPGTTDASWLDLDLAPGAFIGRGRKWRVEVDAGTTHRFGPSTAKRCMAFLPVPSRPIEVRLYGEDGLAARFTLQPRAQRFQSLYLTGAYTRQRSRVWGDDGLALVLIQQRYQAEFPRLKQPVLYLGGDFNYQRIEGLVRYFRTHGVNALGYRPDYDRDPNESLLEMGKHDLPDVQQWLGLAGGGQRAHVVALCLGGIHARAMAHAGGEFASLTTIGTPHDGSRLADVYNAVPALPLLHRILTGDPRIHRYKDDTATMAGFNREVGLQPMRNIVLDATGQRTDSRYDWTTDTLRWLAAHETGKPLAEVHGDGLILVEGQAPGTRFATWNCDHAGMINDGLSATYFDAYTAHQQLLDGLEARP